MSSDVSWQAETNAEAWLNQYSFTSTETRRLAQDGHLDFYTCSSWTIKKRNDKGNFGISEV